MAQLKGVVCKGQTILGRLLREDPAAWRPELGPIHPGSINLYVPGNHRLFTQALIAWDGPVVRLLPVPVRRVACKIEGVDAWILTTQYPEPNFGPSGHHTLFEIVVSARIEGVHYGSTLTLEYEAPLGGPRNA